MKPENLYIYQTLAGTGAQPMQAVEVGGGLSLTHWSNDSGHTLYEGSDHHTLSLYLEGGRETYRVEGERTLGRGHPGAVCVLPAQGRSEWVIENSFRFMHLYFERTAFDRMVGEGCERDPARVALREVNLQSDAYIDHLCRRVILPLDWREPSERMALSHAGQLLLLHLLRHYTEESVQPAPRRGGLAPHVLRRVLDFVEAHLEAGLTIGDLAAVAELSDFHFSRMFALTMGQSPHQYILQRRIERAKERLMNDEQPLAEIALACGFSSQSHFTTRFRKATGLTPNEFRQLA